VRNDGKWTEARYHSFIVSALRYAFRKWPPKYETLKEAFTKVKKNSASGRLARHFKCSLCKKDFPQSKIQVDHIFPIINPKKGFIDWNTFVERLFCEKKNLQVLCKPCHKIKTNLEKEERKKYGKSNQDS
jgi:5-methylcytosine-specific restriction endonuclease McrA